jgi:hypothetical protein
MARRHLIGLLLATEESWPTAFEAVLRGLGPIRYGGETHQFPTERIVNEPFDLRAVPRYALVIDRLSWWYVVPREWLKKMALMDNVYLLNNPFTFQAMEKHSAECAGIRLGLNVPKTWLIPHKLPPANPRFAHLAERFQADAFEEFRATSLPHLTEVLVTFLESPEFDELLVRVVRAEPAELYEPLVERVRERIRAWVADQTTAVA